MPPTPYQVHISAAVAEEMRGVVARAVARGQRVEALEGMRKLVAGLTWLADELGESRHSLRLLGELRVAVSGPVGVVFAVDRDKREVHVGRFRLLGIHRLPGST